MSIDCKTRSTDLSALKPKFVLFHAKGVLRVLRPKEDKMSAHGMVFFCPRCLDNPKKKHYVILIFEGVGVPKTYKPWGRFIPSYSTVEGEEGKAASQLDNFENMSLWMVQADSMHPWLVPADVECKWQGMVQKGKVTWRPSWLERWANK